MKGMRRLVRTELRMQLERVMNDFDQAQRSSEEEEEEALRHQSRRHAALCMYVTVEARGLQQQCISYRRGAEGWLHTGEIITLCTCVAALQTLELSHVPVCAQDQAITT